MDHVEKLLMNILRKQNNIATINNKIKIKKYEIIKSKNELKNKKIQYKIIK